MNVLPKRIILTTDNDLWKRAHPVLLTIFCWGVQETKAKHLMLAALLSILTAPYGWLVSVRNNLLHVAQITAIWWLFRNHVAIPGVSDKTLLVLALLALFYRHIYADVLDLLLNLLVLCTSGRFLRWLCRGWLSGRALRQLSFTKKPIERLVTTTVPLISPPYRRKYDELMDLYLDSNNPRSEERLNTLVAAYSQGELL